MTQSSVLDQNGKFTCLDQINLPIFALEMGPADVPVYAAFNTAARETTRRPLQNDLGRSAIDVYGHDAGRMAQSHHAKVFRTGKSHDYELILPVDGDLHRVHTTLEPCLNEDGDVAYVVGTTYDLSRAQPETIPETLPEILPESPEISLPVTTSAEQFIYLAAHDLRAPLRQITFLTELIKEQHETGATGIPETIALLEQVSTKAGTLLDDVLTYAASGCQQPIAPKSKVRRFSVPTLCADISKILDPHKQHKVTVCAPTLYADKVVFQLLLRNLIDNAIKHSDRSHVVIDINVQVAGDNLLEMTFEDNGIGFDDPDKTFSGNGNHSSKSGYGLLAIRRLIHSQGGTITAANISGGSRITVTLPGRSFDRMRPPKPVPPTAPVRLLG